MPAILFSGAIGPVLVSVIISEGHQSSLGITENPIETGAKVTDHAYVMPKKLTLEFADANAAATYNALVRFQESRQPFTVVSGLYLYRNMLIKDLSADRDKQFASVLSGRCELQEIIIVSTAYAVSQGGSDGAATGQGSAANPASGAQGKAATPSSSTTTPGPTADRASGTVVRGDVPGSTIAPARNQSILHGMFGG
jgi:hypothetical protein